MVAIRSLALLCVTAILLAVTVQVFSVTVQTNVGNIAGQVKQLHFEGQQYSVSTFLGIPYGESTAGANRFQKPVPKAPFNSTYNAIDFKASCTQTGATGHSEDCLFLNVYVPGTPTAAKGLTVIIWIHGGGFKTGSSNIYRAEALSAFGNAIVVTINYRLYEFGFLCSGDSRAPGNYGLWDQHLAIKWVHDNIRFFGGNQNEITISGESAGAASVQFQALYPGNEGLFKRVIAESGTVFADWAFTRVPNADSLMHAAGCTSIACLRSRSTSQLLAAASPQMQFIPCIDGEFIKEMPTDTMLRNHTVTDRSRKLFYSLDYLTGVNSMEGGLYMTTVWNHVLGVADYNHFPVIKHDFQTKVTPFLLYMFFGNLDHALKIDLENAILHHYIDPISDPNNTTQIRDAVVKMSSDAAFFAPALSTVYEHAQMNSTANTYLYLFSLAPQTHVIQTPKWLTGANHADEVPFVFGVSLFLPSSTSTERLMSKAIITMWSNFAKTGDPNKPSDVTKYMHTTWSAYDRAQQGYIDLSVHLSPASRKTQFAPEANRFWLHDVPAIFRAHQLPAFQPGGHVVG